MNTADGTHFDPKLGRKFVGNRKAFEELYDRLLNEEDDGVDLFTREAGE